MKNDPNSRLTAETVQVTADTRLSGAAGEGCLVLVQRGSGILRWPQGERAAGPGSLLLLGRQACGFEPAAGQRVELLSCRFALDMLTEQKAKTFHDRTPLVLQGTPAWSGRMRTLLELVASAWQEPDFPGRLYLALLLHYTAQQAAAENRSAAQPKNETVERICAYLAANYRQKLTLGEVAAQFYLSPYYLSRLFRRVTGQSIVDYINVQRIEAARRLLETTDMRINAVAEETGFSTAAHFRRVFREQLGVGPTQYRKAYRGKKD